MHKVWTDFERNFIVVNAGKVTDKEGAKQLSAIAGRTITVNAWRKQRQLLGVVKASGRGVCKVKEKVVAPEPALLANPVVDLNITGDNDGTPHNNF